MGRAWSFRAGGERIEASDAVSARGKNLGLLPWPVCPFTNAPVLVASVTFQFGSLVNVTFVLSLPPTPFLMVPKASVSGDIIRSSRQTVCTRSDTSSIELPVVIGT